MIFKAVRFILRPVTPCCGWVQTKLLSPLGIRPNSRLLIVCCLIFSILISFTWISANVQTKSSLTPSPLDQSIARVLSNDLNRITKESSKTAHRDPLKSENGRFDDRNNRGGHGNRDNDNHVIGDGHNENGREEEVEDLPAYPGKLIMSNFKQDQNSEDKIEIHNTDLENKSPINAEPDVVQLPVKNDRLPVENDRVRKTDVEKTPPTTNDASPLLISRNQRALLIGRGFQKRYSSGMRKIMQTFQYSKFFLRNVVILDNSNLPKLVQSSGKPAFSVVAFDSLMSYHLLSEYRSLALTKFCSTYGIPMFIFSSPNGHKKPVSLLPNTLSSVPVTGISVLSSVSPALRITRPGNFSSTMMEPGVLFQTAKGSQFLPIAVDLERSAASEDKVLSAVLIDLGKTDGVKKAFFGAPLDTWMTQMLFLDCLSFLTDYKLSLPLERYVMIDVDDIFLARSGLKIHKDDVQTMLAAQNKWSQQYMPGFKLNLGFIGKFFRSGDPDDQEGDEALVAHASEFNWFDHSFSHSQPHKKDAEVLLLEYQKNQAFAQAHNITVMPTYTVTSHHSGVYPVHPPLYDLWEEKIGITVTTTEEYPHLKPARERRGFIHRDISVLPRQTCGLFTVTPFKESLNGGMEQLNSNIEGGNLFLTFLYNPVNLYMTHTQNYGNDRLAQYTFDRAFAFVSRWTNLKLGYKDPEFLAQYYFNLYPEEKDPVWTNPMDDKRHREIWPKTKPCSLPDFLIVGPQKTGTTALYTFLNLNPQFLPSKRSVKFFEEVQFFSNPENYFQGLDWYLEYFTNTSNMSAGTLQYDKSANYFDSKATPKRAYALLPNAKIIITLIDPIARAFSWYQHMRAHNDPAAMSLTFYEVITAPANSPTNVLQLMKRTVEPGFYTKHVMNWLQYYSPDQILIVDGELFKEDPLTVLHQVQTFLGLTEIMDYKPYLRFDQSKGFWCRVGNQGRSHCLGKHKGRSKRYGLPDAASQQYLHKLYESSNAQLKTYLRRQRYTQPKWL